MFNDFKRSQGIMNWSRSEVIVKNQALRISNDVNLESIVMQPNELGSFEPSKLSIIEYLYIGHVQAIHCGLLEKQTKALQRRIEREYFNIGRFGITSRINK